MGDRVTRQNTELRSVETECGQRFGDFFFFSFINNSLTFVAKCVRSGSPYALISGKFCFNIFITTGKYYYIRHYGCPRCNFWSTMLGVMVYFFVKLTNLHTILSKHKAPEDNVITLLLPWPVDKNQMSARLKCANISYQLLEILRRRKDGQSMSARLKCANISYPISTLPEHLHSTSLSPAKTTWKHTKQKETLSFPLYRSLPVSRSPTPPYTPLHWETQPHPLTLVILSFGAYEASCFSVAPYFSFASA